LSAKSETLSKYVKVRKEYEQKQEKYACIQEDILKYTERVITTAGIPSVTVYLGKQPYRTCKNPHNNKGLFLLLPATILSPLPVAECFDDIDWICHENERVRKEINEYFDLGKKTKLHKSQILALMHSSLSFRSALVTAYKTIPKSAYDFSADPAGEYAWLAAAREYVAEYPLLLAGEPLDTVEDVLNITTKICKQFKSLIENNGLCKLLYNSDGTSKHESAAQLLFYGVADSYCDANDVDLTKEGNRFFVRNM